MKYKHHPKQEYPDAQQQEDEKIIAALREVRERRAARPSEVMEDYYEGFKPSLATPNPVQRSTGQVFRSSQAIEKAIDQAENQKQQAGFYAGATERLGIKSVTSDMEFPKEWEGEFIEPTLFERFNSLCTPAQYVQLKNEIRDVYYQWLNMSELCKYTLDGFKPEATVPWPKELEGFTEEIIESL